MGAANSTQHRETRHALKEKVKEVAQIALLLEEVTFARSLESLIESPSFFEDTVVLNFRNDLIKASNRDDPKPKPPPPRGDLSRYFQQFEIRKAQLCQLVSLANVWKLQQKDTVRYIEQEASHWQKDHSLFWGRYLQPSTGLAGLKRLVREIEQTEKLSAIRRRLLLVIVHRAVNAETDRLSAKVKRSRGIKTKLTTIKTKLSQYREDQHPDNRVRQRTTKEKRRLTDKISEFQSKETKLTKEQQELHKEIKSYPEGKSRRQQAIRKLHKDVWAADILSEEEFKREEDKFMDYARWGKKYDKLEPLGILFFLGNTHHLWYEREKWYPAAYDAMRSYWQDLSGIGPLCHFYTPLVTALIQTYWNPLSAGRTVQEADTGRSSPGSIPVGSHGGASPEDQRHPPELLQALWPSAVSPRSVMPNPNITVPMGSSPVQESPSRLPSGIEQTHSVADSTPSEASETASATGDLSVQCSHQHSESSPSRNALIFSQQDVISFQNAGSQQFHIDSTYSRANSTTHQNAGSLPIYGGFTYSQEDTTTQNTGALVYNQGNTATHQNAGSLPIYGGFTYSQEDITTHQNTRALAYNQGDTAVRQNAGSLPIYGGFTYSQEDITAHQNTGSLAYNRGNIAARRNVGSLPICGGFTYNQDDIATCRNTRSLQFHGDFDHDQGDIAACQNTGSSPFSKGYTRIPQNTSLVLFS